MTNFQIDDINDFAREIQTISLCLSGALKSLAKIDTHAKQQLIAYAATAELLSDKAECILDIAG